MERHKSLYKEKSSMLSPKINRVNERTAIRAKERNERFISRRNISVSPPVTAMTAKAAEENKENILEQASVEQPKVEPAVTNSSRIARVACNRNGEVLNRQEKFLHRFIEWRQSKKQQDEIKKHGKVTQKQPFVPVGKNAESKTRQTSATSSFAPKNHRFKPPEGLKNPVSTLVKATPSNAKQRQSIYTVAPTPDKKKQQSVDVLKRFNIPRKAFPNNHLVRPGATLPGTTPKSAVLKASHSTNKTQTQKPLLLSGVKTTTATTTTKAIVQRPTVPKPTSITTQKSTAPSVVDGTKKLNSVKSKAPAFIKPPPLKLPPPSIQRSIPTTSKPKIQTGARIVKPIRGGGGATNVVKQSGAVGKVKAAAVSVKRPDPISKPKPNLAVCMKAKKVNSTVSTRKATAATKNSAKLKLSKQQLLEVVGGEKSAPIVETPRDVLSNTNSFGAFVTSTQRKSQSSSQSTLEFLSSESNIVDSISPVESVETIPNQQVSAIKRQPLKTAPTDEMVSNNPIKSPKKGKKNKFNFVRYDNTPSKLFDGDVTTPGKDEQTPLTSLKDNNNASDQRPLNYLSPFVSVTRGKVNSKIEKEKRNSIYLQTNAVNSTATQEAEHNDDVAMRRILETVRYFRKQLSDETKRLHDICDKWELYKSENLARLQETGGDDMINVTIGQTKLLTSKKFMQFSGLIDRCEKGATSPDLLINDGSENTKPITAVDLEGFWSMVGLQIDNVEKRFMNLDRWRENDWLDPDHVQQQQQVTKVRKSKKSGTVQSSIVGKAKPSSDLQQLIRKMHADMRKKKALEAAAAKKADSGVGEPDVVLTPTRKRRSHGQAAGTPQQCIKPSSARRISIILKNRKFHSPAPTILTMNTSNRRSFTPQIHHNHSSHMESPKLHKYVDEFQQKLKNLQRSGSERNELWMSALKGAEKMQRRSVLLRTPSPSFENISPPAAKVRKSILKTPGTAKAGNPKNVVFNEKLRVKKYKFTIDSDQSDSDGNEADNKVDEEVDERADAERNTSG